MSLRIISGDVAMSLAMGMFVEAFSRNGPGG